MVLKEKMNWLFIEGAMSAILMFPIRFILTNRVMDPVSSAELTEDTSAAWKFIQIVRALMEFLFVGACGVGLTSLSQCTLTSHVTVSADIAGARYHMTCVGTLDQT
jgi:hypothetical protein